MFFVRGANIVAGILLVLGWIGFLGGLAGALREFEREPEDVWLVLMGLALLGALAALCFTNARRYRAARAPTGGLIIGNAVALAGLTALLVMERGDPAAVALIVLCLIGPSAVLAHFAIARVARGRA